MKERGHLKTLGVLTDDFSVYYDLVQTLRARRIPFLTLAANKPIPFDVGVVVTSAGEAEHIDHPHVVAFTTPEETIEEAMRVLHSPGPFRTCVIGVDPGERPGIAVLADGRVLRLVHAPKPEAVHAAIQQVVDSVPAERFIVRVGHGAPTFRDRILQTLGGLPVELELVNEHRSTPSDYHSPAERDTGAAANIALHPGTPLALGDLRPAIPTEGELRDIQRKSRIVSGDLTISRALARNVALGRLTIAEAVDRMRQKA